MDNSYTPLKNYLSSQGKDFSQANLASLAQEKGMSTYSGTDQENSRLASLIGNNSSLNSAPVSSGTLNYTPINIPTTKPVDVSMPALNQADEFLKRTAVEDTQNQKNAAKISTQLANLIPELQGESAALADEQNKLGLNRLKQNLQNLNSEILLKTAEMNKSDVELVQSLQSIEDKPIAMEFITGQQQSVTRQAQIARALKSAEIGVLNARVIGEQGNIALAMEMANQAVAQKYSPIKESINLYKMQLEAIQPLLSRDEKKQGREQEIRTNLALKDIDTRIANENKIQELVIKASSQNAPQNLIAKASLAKTPMEAATILGQYAGDYWAIEKTKAEINKLKSEAYKINHPTGNKDGLPVNSSAQAWLEQYNAGSMSLEDIYTKIGNSKTAEVTKNELAKLIAAQGGKRVLSMDDAQVSSINEQIKNIDDLVNGSVGSIVGFIQGGLGVSPDSLNTGKQDALAIANNLVANQTLQSLADAKAKGVTFGALSEAELNAVASAASRVASKAIMDKETGKIKGFTGSEKEFIKDLNNIKTGLQKSIVKKTTSAASPVQNQIDMAVKALNSVNTTNNTSGYIFK